MKTQKQYFIDYYMPPLGLAKIILVSDGKFLTGLYFEGSKDANKFCEPPIKQNNNLDIFNETKNWLDLYFSGNKPNFTPKIKLENRSDFQTQVTKYISQIDFGQTTTYGEIASKIALERNIKKMSAQAVGGAVGSNPICIIIPCHRVIGKNGDMVGYGGGIKNKIKLLQFEKQMFKN